jgi:hypothetical protein
MALGRSLLLSIEELVKPLHLEMAQARYVAE